MSEAKPQTDREIAEMIAKFRTPPGLNWTPLADDIETVLKGRPVLDWDSCYEWAYENGLSLCDGYCQSDL